jgi:hypothetical protein
MRRLSRVSELSIVVKREKTVMLCKSRASSQLKIFFGSAFQRLVNRFILELDTCHVLIYGFSYYFFFFFTFLE